MYDETLKDHPFGSLPSLSPATVQQLAQQFKERPWEARCPRHAQDSHPGPCVDCGAVRREAEGLRRSSASKKQAERQARRDAISACGLCDSRGLHTARYEDGPVFMVRCPHDVAELDMAVHGALQKRAAEVAGTRPSGVSERYLERIQRQLEESRRATARSKAMSGHRNKKTPDAVVESASGHASH